MIVVTALCGLLVAACVGPSIVLAVECCVAALPRFGAARARDGRRFENGNAKGSYERTDPGDAPLRPRVGVLIPAHNEELVLRPTLRSLRPQLRSDDRILVVADNCEDATADIALEEGVEVVVRNDEQRRGKGWALARGRDEFADASTGLPTPEVLVMVDADTEAEAGSIDRLAERAAETGLPVQSIYLMRADTDGDSVGGVSSLAWLVRNYVRPLGLHRLRLPCLLNGSGMALPWRLAKDAPLAGGHVGEEYLLAVDLAIDGSPPVFCPEAVVLGALPNAEGVAVSQRRRWSHTQMAVMANAIPRLVRCFFRTGRVGALALALDLSVPPLMVLIAIHAIAVATLAGAALAGEGIAAMSLAVAGSLAMIAVSILVAWARFGRSRISGVTPAKVASYFARHAPHYLSFFVNRQTAWTKTPREDGSAVSAAGSTANRRVD